MWEFSGRVYRYRVEVSNDNTNWTTAVDKTNTTSTAQTQHDNFSASALFSFAANQSNHSVFNYEVGNGGGALSFSIRF